MGKLLLLCILFGSAISIFVIGVVRIVTRREEERLGLEVMARFGEVQLPSEEPRFALDGRTAEVVHDFSKQRGRHGIGLSVNRVCRNPLGEYFHVIISAEDDSTYVNHLNEERARLVLQGAGVKLPPPVAVAPEEDFDAPDLAMPDFDVSRPAFPMGMPGPQAVAKKPGRAGSREDEPTPAMLRALAVRALESPGVPTLAGFVVTSFILMGVAFPGGTPPFIDPVTVIYICLAGMLLVLFIMFFLKTVQGRHVDGESWFVRSISFVTSTWLGIILAVGVYDIFVWEITLQ